LSAILDPALASPLPELSAREIQVLKLVAEGRTSKEIARMLGLFPSSIYTYRSRIIAKLGLARPTGPSAARHPLRADRLRTNDMPHKGGGR
jgi:DNA-binding CsgD family transcriptional regulator